jgi:hypothetical protein
MDEAVIRRIMGKPAGSPVCRVPVLEHDGREAPAAFKPTAFAGGVSSPLSVGNADPPKQNGPQSLAGRSDKSGGESGIDLRSMPVSGCADKMMVAKLPPPSNPRPLQEGSHPTLSVGNADPPKQNGPQSLADRSE